MQSFWGSVAWLRNPRTSQARVGVLWLGLLFGKRSLMLAVWQKRQPASPSYPTAHSVGNTAAQAPSFALQEQLGAPPPQGWRFYAHTYSTLLAVCAAAIAVSGKGTPQARTCC